MPVKVLDSNGSGSDADIAAGIDWARTHGAKVINLSLGGSADDPMLADAVQNAIAANVVVVAAAGNDGSEGVNFPAAYPGVIAVSATDHHGALTVVLELRLADRRRPRPASTSRRRRSARATTTQTESGTSFSSPMVAGVAALVRSEHPSWSQAQVADQIRDTARDIGLPGVDPAFGHGMRRSARGGGWAGRGSRPGAAFRRRRTERHTDRRDPAGGRQSRTPPRSRPRPTRTGTACTSQPPVGTRCTSRDPPSTLQHEMDPIVELYQPDRSFAASQELAGGDLLFKITVTGDYFVRVRNFNGSTASYTVTVQLGCDAESVRARARDRLRCRGRVGRDRRRRRRRSRRRARRVRRRLPDSRHDRGLRADARSFTRAARAIPTDPMGGGGMATGDLDGDGTSDVAIPTDAGNRLLHEHRPRRRHRDSSRGRE